MTAGTHVFTHTFSLNAIQANTSGATGSQLGGTTAFSPVITVQGDPRVQFFLAGVSNAVSHQTILLIAPGLGLVGTDLKQFGSPGFGFFATPEVRVVAQGPAPALPPGASSFAVNQSSPGGASAAGADRLLLRMVSTDATRKEDPADDIDIGEDPNINIRELTTESLKVLFGKLPDGRYRIVWYRGAAMGSATERVILDVLLRDGKPINFDDLEKPAVPLKTAPMNEPEAQVPAAPAAAETDQAASADVTLPASNETYRTYKTYVSVAPGGSIAMPPAAAAADQAQLDQPAPADAPRPASNRTQTDTTYKSHEFQDPPASPDSHTPLIAAAALVEMALLRQRRNAADGPAETSSPQREAFTRAARLYRRLRRREQTSTADFD
jgi:hypothetical protein